MTKTAGSDFIDRKRRAFVNEEGQKLFDVIIQAVVSQNPNHEYPFEVHWQQRADVIDKMILKRVTELFEELNTTLQVERKNSSTVIGKAIMELPPVKDQFVTKFFWSRRPGKFVNKKTGAEVTLNVPGIGPQFSGTVREWYETLVETLIDAGNEVHKVMLVSPEAIHVSPDICTILECSVLYRPSYGDDKLYTGLLCNRYKIYKDPTLAPNQARIIGVAHDTRFTADVEVMDMNII